MKKGIAVPYIIAILLGIAVIGLIGYWFYLTGVRWAVTVSETDCRNKFSQYCSVWATYNYAPGKSKMTYPSTETPCDVQKNWGTADDWNCFAPGCTGIGIKGPANGDECVTRVGTAG